MTSFFKKHARFLLYSTPLVLLCIVVFIGSLSFMLHDFGNSYFPALLSKQGIAPESVLFDIYDFNQYVWSQGYTDLLLDFYYNSPFTVTAFYPFTFIEDAYLAKAIFNGINCIALILCTYRLVNMYQVKQLWGLLFIPILFYLSLIHI